jgi:hypothetical protein
LELEKKNREDEQYMRRGGDGAAASGTKRMTGA